MEYPHEYLTMVSGYIRHDFGSVVIRSLTFQTNIRMHGPFGEEKGGFFCCTLICSKIIGFYGRSGAHLDSIGVNSEPISCSGPFEFIEPFGSRGGSPWDDGIHAEVREINVRAGSDSDSVTFEYENNGSTVQSTKQGGSGGGKTCKV